MAYEELGRHRGAGGQAACCSSCAHGGACASGLGLSDNTKSMLKTIAILGGLAFLVVRFTAPRVRLM